MLLFLPKKKEIIRRAVCKNDTCWVAGEILVKFDDEIMREEAERFIASKGFEVTRWYPKNMALLKVPEGKELEHLSIFNRYEIVKFAELNLFLRFYGLNLLFSHLLEGGIIEHIEPSSIIEYKESRNIWNWIKELFFRLRYLIKGLFLG